MYVDYFLITAHVELPIPTMTNTTELKDITKHYIRATNPTELAFTYEELKSLDVVNVSLIPEKKGTLIKHSEYMVESKASFSSSAHVNTATPL